MDAAITQSGIRNFVFFINSNNYNLTKKNDQKKEKDMTVKCKNVNLDSIKSDDWKINIITIIGKEYTNPDLSLSSISNRVSKNEKSVSNFLNEKFKLSFKKYLNYIRINEAERLIHNVHISLKEIAHLVGYSSSNHFTRVFKQYKNITPTEYRDQLLKNGK